MTKLKAVGWGFLGMSVALVLYVIGATLWMDHQRVNALWDYTNQQAQARAQQVPQVAKPTPEPTVKK